ncbi:hypothetical protein HNQ96_005431 [Aminobacter lissarensis]|uniref:Uncharacterized protein n=1 Tax=Aminobacter carboxidus TaxID=376165 RepID=A0A8E1WLD7_9HYPH|nr:hypothetical protein [Aminobacter lissarensis]
MYKIALASMLSANNQNGSSWDRRPLRRRLPHRHFPAFPRGSERGFDAGDDVQAVFGCNGRLGAVVDGLDAGLPLADKAAAGDLARVFDRLPFEVAAARHALAEIDSQHAAIEGPPEMKAPSA